MKTRAFITSLCAAALLAGCGGQSTPLVPAVPGAANAAANRTAATPATQTPPASDAVVLTADAIPAGHHKAKLQIHIRIARKHHRAAHFISGSTLGMTMAFSGPTNLNQTVGLTPTSPGCSGSPSATTCTFTVALLAGSYTGTISTFDKAPVSGAIPGNANLLSEAKNVPFTMTGGLINTISFSLGGVIWSLNPPAYLASDGAASSPAVALGAEDADNNPITGTAPYANPVTVSVSETGGTGHATLSLNGGTGATHVTATKPSDTVTLNYDGKSPSGYALSIGVSASAYSGHGGGSATIEVTTIVVTNGEYTPGTLALKGNGDVQTLDVSETNAPSTPTYSVSTSGCSAIADANTPVSSSGTGTLVIFARSMASSSGCTIDVSDGTTTLPVAVTNTYSGVEGTPVVSYVATLLGIAQQISVGPDGDLWFAETAYPSHVGRITATGSSPTLNEYSLPDPIPAYPPQITGIAPGPDGNMWFAGSTYFTGIGNISPAGATNCPTTCNLYATPYNQNPYGIVAGPDGAMWFSRFDEGSTNYISRATTDGTVTNNYSSGITSASGVGHLVVGPDGNLWFDEFNCTGKIGKMTTAGTATEYSIDDTHDITVGSDGNIWLAGGSVWKVTTSGTATAISGSAETVPTGAQTYGAYGPYRITTGPDGAIWYVFDAPASDGNFYIGRIDPSTDAVTYMSIGNDGGVDKPYGITAGPDGAIWFTGFNGSGTPAIGRIALSTSSAARHRANKLRPKH